VPEEREAGLSGGNLPVAEGGIPGGIRRTITAGRGGVTGSPDINQADSGNFFGVSVIPTVHPSAVSKQLSATGNALNAICGFPPAVGYFFLAVRNSGIVMRDPTSIC